MRVARAPELRRVNLAFAGFSVGEHATWLAVAYYALERGGAGEVGIAAAAQLLPGVVLTPFSSYAGDRFRAHRALATGYAVQCLAMVATAVCMARGLGVATYAFGAIAATAISFTRPIMGSLLPTVTHAPSDLVAANVVTGVIEQVGLFVGPVLAGIVLSLSSPATVFAICGGITGAASLAVLLLRVDDVPRARPSSTAVVRHLVAGFATLRTAPLLRLLVGCVAVAGLVRGIGDVVFVTFAEERLDAGGATAGLLAAVYGAGGLVGATSVTRLVRTGRLSGQYLAAAACAAVALMVAAVSADHLSAVVAFALLGASEVLLVLTSTVTIQRLAPTDVLARVFGIVEGAQMGHIAIGSLLIASLTSSSSLGRAFLVMAAVVGILVLALVALLRRHGDAIPAVDEDVVDRLLADPVFAPLPAPVVERLAREAERLVVPAGAAIVTEGAVGDRYYLVVDGAVDVSIAGEHVRFLGSRASFGEIALLRDVPRTATATAFTEVSLLAIRRDEFLTAVTGHPRSLGRATDTAEGWLAAG